MEFLENAIFSSDTGDLLGAMLTHFQPEDYCNRASVSLFTLEQLQEQYQNMHPMGFTVAEGGVLLSDSSVRSTLTTNVFNYMDQECNRLGHRSVNLIDLVLLGVENDAYLIPNYESACKEEDPHYTTVSFRSLKVSSSSFNIYTRYMRDDGSFRTYGLLDQEYGDPRTNYVAFPENTDLSSFAASLSLVGSTEINGGTYNIYRSTLGLTAFYVSVGEAFLNYLSYHVAFYNIGEKVLMSLREHVHPTEKAEYVRGGDIYTSVRPKANVFIEHQYKESRLPELLRCNGNNDEILALFSRCPESTVTYQWIQRVRTSPWYTAASGEEDPDELCYIAATNLLTECRNARLKYALELLEHRYYIYSQGLFNDSTGILLKGGGVDGQSVKQLNFGNR